jgi:hypothetical protein
VLKPGYAPIEQYGESPDLKQGPWTDLFALASVLYVACSGVRPAPSVERVVADRLKPLADVAAGRFRPEFLAAIDMAMAVLPQHRPQSIAEFRGMLLGQIAVPQMAKAGAAPAGGGPAPRQQAAQIPNNLPRQRTSFVGRETRAGRAQGAAARRRAGHAAGHGRLGKTRSRCRWPPS